MPIPTIAGWAVVDRNIIDIRTVSDTRRAAIVNWLVVNGTMIFNHMTDADIEALWHAECGSAICTTVYVNVTER